MVFWGKPRTYELNRDIILDLAHLRLRGPFARAAQSLVHLLRGKWQEWGEHDIAVRHNLQGGPQDGG